MHSLTDWAATEEREGGWWEEGDGDRKRQRDYKEKQTQTDRREEQIRLAHPLKPNWWKDRVNRTGKAIQK